MDNRITLIGCAFKNLPVVFDICLEKYGSTEFYIYKNIEVDSSPELSVKTMDYKLIYYEPGENFQKKGDYLFLELPGHTESERCLSILGIDGSLKNEY